MEDHLEVEVRNGWTRDAHVVVGGDGPCPGVDERPIRRLDRLEEAVTVAIETGCGRRSEDGIAFELDQREIGLDALDDRIEEVAKHPVRGRDASAEVDSVLVLDA